MPSDWIPLHTLQTPILQQNLHYLQAAGAEIFPQLQPPPIDENLWLQNHEGLIRCRTGTNPPQWIFGEIHPREELNRLIAELQQYPKDLSLLVLLGNAAGYALACVLPELQRNSHLRILVLEPSTARIRATLALLRDVNTALKTGRLYFAVGTPNSEGILSAVRSYALWGYEPAACYRSPEIPLADDLEDWLLKYREESALYQQKRQEIISRISLPKTIQPKKEIKNVLLVDFWAGAPGGVHIQAIQKALHARSVNTQILTLNRYRIQDHGDEYRRQFGMRWLQTLETLQPDLILSYAHHAPQLISADLFAAFPCTWLQVVSTIAYYETQYYPQEHTAVIEKNLIPRLQRYGAPQVFYVPIVADYTAEQPIRSDGRFPVVFIGNSLGWSPEAVHVFFETIKERENLIRYIREAESVLRCLDVKTNLYRYLDEHPVPQISSEKEQYEVFRYLLCQATAARRIRLLESLIPLGLHIFGGDWNNVLSADSPLRGCLRGYLPIAEEPKIFAYGNLFLNIHSVGHMTGPNMRFFNTPGMGGFQISDQPDFSHFLLENRETIYYRTDAELVDRVQYFLSHPQDREEIRICGWERVRKEWTYQHWLNWIAAELKIALPDSDL